MSSLRKLLLLVVVPLMFVGVVMGSMLICMIVVGLIALSNALSAELKGLFSRLGWLVFASFAFYEAIMKLLGDFSRFDPIAIGLAAAAGCFLLVSWLRDRRLEPATPPID